VVGRNAARVEPRSGVFHHQQFCPLRNRALEISGGPWQRPFEERAVMPMEEVESFEGGSATRRESTRN
jgi:hypothetical protein